MLSSSRRLFLGNLLAASSWGKTSLLSRMGLEIYSLREQAEKDLAGTLAFVRKLGIRELEVSEDLGGNPAAFRKMLDQHGLRVTSVMADYRRLSEDCDSVGAHALALGAKYVVCSTIPHHGKYLAMKDCKPAAERLNSWGERLLRSGIHCCYHTHGTEFKPLQDGTVFDFLAKCMDPRFANFEMDVFWIVYGGQDPVKMLRQYAGRFPLMHVKDIRKGTILGRTPADVREEESVPLGQGIVDLPAALRAAVTTGVRHFYIEDEAVNAAEQLPESLRYVRSLG